MHRELKIHNHQHKTSGLFSKVLSHLLLLSPRKTVESRTPKLPVGCGDKPGLGPLNHSPAVWFGAVACRISIQITILPIRDKQGKVVTGVKTLIDVLDTAARWLARMRAVGLSFSWTRGPGRFVNSTQRTRTQQFKVGLQAKPFQFQMFGFAKARFQINRPYTFQQDYSEYTKSSM